MSTILLLLQIVPALLEIIKSIEKLMPEGGKGAKKLELVKDIVAVSYEGANEIMPQVEKIVNVAVAAANQTGAFKTTTPRPHAQPAAINDLFDKKFGLDERPVRE